MIRVRLFAVATRAVLDRAAWDGCGGRIVKRARTLPADFRFAIWGDGELQAEAVVTDPCMWSAELPHLYHVEVEARQGDEWSPSIMGDWLAALAPRRPVDFAPGTG